MTKKLCNNCALLYIASPLIAGAVRGLFAEPNGSPPTPGLHTAMVNDTGTDKLTRGATEC